MRLGDAFWLHKVAPKTTPLIHVAMSKRPEIVLFGDRHTLVPPFALQIGEFAVTASGADDSRCTISHFPMNAEGGSRTRCSLELTEILKVLAEQGATYPEVVELIRQADGCRNLSCRVRQDALPQVVAVQQLARAGQVSTRPASADTALADSVEIIKPDKTMARQWRCIRRQAVVALPPWTATLGRCPIGARDAASRKPPRGGRPAVNGLPLAGKRGRTLLRSRKRQGRHCERVIAEPCSSACNSPASRVSPTGSTSTSGRRYGHCRPQRLRQESNIVDAVKGVLGEQGGRARGSEMADVIFNGFTSGGAWAWLNSPYLRQLRRAWPRPPRRSSLAAASTAAARASTCSTSSPAASRTSRTCSSAAAPAPSLLHHRAGPR